MPGDTLASFDLRRRIPLPIVRHQAPLDATYEVLMGAGDVYMRGHQKFGDAIRAAGLVRRWQYTVHAAKRGRHDHPIHGLPHDGDLSLRHLSLCR